MYERSIISSLCLDTALFKEMGEQWGNCLQMSPLLNTLAPRCERPSGRRSVCRFSGFLAYGPVPSGQLKPQPRKSIMDFFFIVSTFLILLKEEIPCKVLPISFLHPACWIKSYLRALSKSLHKEVLHIWNASKGIIEISFCLLTIQGRGLHRLEPAKTFWCLSLWLIC